MILLQRGAGAGRFRLRRRRLGHGVRLARLVELPVQKHRWRLAIVFFAISLFMAWHQPLPTVATPAAQDLGLMGSAPAAPAQCNHSRRPRRSRPAPAARRPLAQVPRRSQPPAGRDSAAGSFARQPGQRLKIKRRAVRGGANRRGKQDCPGGGIGRRTTWVVAASVVGSSPPLGKQTTRRMETSAGSIRATAARRLPKTSAGRIPADPVVPDRRHRHRHRADRHRQRPRAPSPEPENLSP